MHKCFETNDMNVWRHVGETMKRAPDYNNNISNTIVYSFDEEISKQPCQFFYTTIIYNNISF